MISTRPSLTRDGSMGRVVSVDDLTATVRTVRSLFTEAGRAQMDTVVLVSEPVQKAHATIRGGEHVMLVILPVRLTRFLRVWTWHVAYRVTDDSTSYEWGMAPVMSLALRAGHKAAGRRAAILRHPSSRHTDD